MGKKETAKILQVQDGNNSRKDLENIENEMVPGMISSRHGIIILVAFIVCRNSHLRGIAMIQTLGALVVILRPEILWIIDVRIMIKTVPVLSVVGVSPLATISLGPVGRIRLLVGHDHP
jgi:hypothetical protein